MERTLYLTLENGQVFQGYGFGAEGEVTGEVVFTTGMTGYLETLTDPSYYGQIVVQTFPLIGNYGVIPSDFESPAPALKAYIVRDWCQSPSNFRCEEDLDSYLREAGVIGLYGIDTRALTRVIREHGVMNGRITADPSPVQTDEVSAYRVTGAIPAVSCKVPATFSPEVKQRRVALWDFGAKLNIQRELVKRGCEVTVMPASSTAEEILALRPDGVMLTNGPGDPAENTGIIAEIRTAVIDGNTHFYVRLENGIGFLDFNAAQVPRAVLLDVGDHIWYDYALEGADFPENGIVAASGFRFAGEEASPAA